MAPEVVDEVERRLAQLEEITMCYCSVLDDCWIAGIDVPWSAPSDCPIAASERFEE
jgi:hypothetical protein